MIALPTWAQAQSASAEPQEIVVTADRAGLLEKKPSSTVFGFDKSLLETPRAATFVSDTTLERYGITSIDNLVEISPSSYTSSYYGVPGSLNIRGTLAENYFRGFKRIEDRGTYATPIGDASEVQIVRGPPTPLYGAGKVGGFLNFIPKTSKDAGKFLDGPTGEIDLTYGSYNKKELTVQGGAPVSIGPIQGGVYGYLDVDDSHSFYHGIYPKRQTAELSGDFNLPGGWTTSVGGMVYHSDGDVQTPGWNRLTQDLIDNGTYITGRNTSLKDINGDGRLQPGEIGYYPYGSALYQIYPYCLYTSCTDANHTLDTGVGTTKLSPRTVFVSSADFSRTTTYTAYYDLAKKLSSNSSIKLQAFYDALNNERFVSYGFPASYQSYVGELRATYQFDWSGFGDLVTTQNFIGASERYTHAHRRESFNSGVIALDRRDLSYGPTATDILDSPFSTNDGGQQGLGWENDIHSSIRDTGGFFTTDITLMKRLEVILGGRYDNYNVSSADVGFLSYEAPNGNGAKSKPTYTASVSYKTDWGIIPYYSYAQAPALEIDQSGGIPTSLLATNGFLSTSYLSEAGVKFQELHSTLVGSLSVYRQTRTQLEQSGGVTSILGTISKGVELEVRYLATKNISFTFAGDMQHTEVKGPDTSFQYIPASVLGVSGVDGFGGSYVVFNFSQLPGRGGNYNYALIPHAVVSLYGTYTSDKYEWGQVGGTLGATHVSKTSTLVENPVTYPDYWLANLSAFYAKGPYTVVLNVDNLFDKLYFTPDADSYANLGALPGVGREWRITLKRKF